MNSKEDVITLANQNEQFMRCAIWPIMMNGIAQDIQFNQSGLSQTTMYFFVC